MSRYSQDYVLGRFDQGARIFQNPSDPRSTRVQMRVRDPEFSAAVVGEFGGSIRRDGYWTLSGGQRVETFLRRWAKRTHRDDVGRALLLMENPGQSADEVDQGRIVSCTPLGSLMTLAAYREALPDVSTRRLRRLLALLVADGKLERLKSQVYPHAGGTTGYRYKRPGLGL